MIINQETIRFLVGAELGLVYKNKKKHFTDKTEVPRFFELGESYFLMQIHVQSYPTGLVLLNFFFAAGVTFFLCAFDHFC
jgi:hypothetical protein